MVVAYDHQGFQAHALLAALHALDLSGFIGFVYGSGFEAQPALLHEISMLLTLIGNRAEVVAEVKSPASFFAALQKHHIQHPALCDKPLSDASNMLLKMVGGCGGAHIQHADFATHHLDDKSYLQQKIEGDSVSLLFIANGHAIEVIGYNLQWTSPANYAPYRYGGAAGHAELSSSVKAQLRYAAEKLTQAFGLRGLNSLDAIVKNDTNGEQVYVLEINPRLSASLDLYIHATHNLFEQHVQACLGQVLVEQAAISLSKAHAVVYTNVDIALNRNFSWPVWAKDCPVTTHTVKISADSPVCSVTAMAENANAAKQLVQARAEQMQQLLKLK